MRRLSLFWLVALLLIPSCSTGHGAQPASGDVSIDDEPAGEDAVSFYFDADEDRTSAERTARSAIEAAGLDVREVQTRVDDDHTTLRVRVRTHLGGHVGFLQRRIDEDVVSAVRQGGDGSVLLDIAAAARLTSGGRLVERDLMERTFELPRDAAATYEYSLAHIGLLVAMLLLGLVTVRIATGRYVARVRRGGGDAVDRIHKLQRLMVIAMFLLPLLALPLVIVGGILVVPEILIGEVFPSAPEAVARMGGVIMIMLLVGALIAVVALPIQPYFRELRDIQQTQAESRRRLIRGVAAGLGIPVVWISILTVLDTVDLSGWFSVVLRVALFAAILGVTPVLIATLFGRAELDPQLRERLLGFARSHGVRVRDIRALKGRADKHANALVAGVIPGFKYIFLTDYLVEEMGDEELMAVVAHEIGHAKKRHLLIKLAVPFVALVGFVGLLLLLNALGVLEGIAFSAFLIAMPLVLIGSIVLLHGVIGLRLEHAADDFASRTVGRESMISALEKLAELNMTKRDTGRVFNLLAQHPSIEERVSRLRRQTEAAA